MRGFKNLSLFVFGLLLLLYFGVWCNGDSENMAAPMEKNEINALYSAIQGFVGKWWNGSDLYPDPCGWTPIQVYLIFTFLFLCAKIYIKMSLFSYFLPMDSFWKRGKGSLVHEKVVFA